MIYVYICFCFYILIYRHIGNYILIYTWCIYVYIYVNIYIYMYMYTYVYVYVFIYIYRFTNILKFKSSKWGPPCCPTPTIFQRSVWRMRREKKRFWDVLRYLVAQSLYKVVPTFDKAILGILAQDPGRTAQTGFTTRFGWQRPCVHMFLTSGSTKPVLIKHNS